MSSLLSLLRRHARPIAYSVGLLLLLFAIVPQLDFFRGSWQALTSARLSFVLLAIAALTVSYIFAAVTYCMLALRPIRLGLTTLVQFASSSLNRIVPSGIGGIGVLYLYLRGQRHSRDQTLAVIALNNSIGPIGHGILLALLLWIDAPARHIFVRGYSLPRLLIGGIVVVAVVGIGVLLLRQERFHAAVERIKSYGLYYRKHAWRIVVALASSIVLTLCYAWMTQASIAAVGGQLSLAACVVVLAARTLGMTLVPTPSGLGGAEAATVGILMAYGVTPAAALAAALIMRLITYIVGFGLGIPAFIFVKLKRLI